MNKLFLVLLVVLIAVPSFFVSVEGLSDYGRSLEPMKLSDVMVKLGKGETLTTQELSFLQQQMDLVQNTTAITSGWIGADKQPHFGTVHADIGYFSIPPIGGCYYGATGQELAGSGVWNKIAFSTSIYDSTSVLIPYLTGGTKFIINPIYASSGLDVFSVSVRSTVLDDPTNVEFVLSSFLKSDDSQGAYAHGYSSDNAEYTAGSFIDPISISDMETEAGVGIEDMYFSVIFYIPAAGSYTLVTSGMSANIVR